MLILHFHNSFLFLGFEQPGFVFKLPIPGFRMYTLLFLCMLHPNMLLWSAKKILKKHDVITGDKYDVTHNTVSADLIFPTVTSTICCQFAYDRQIVMHVLVKL